MTAYTGDLRTLFEIRNAKEANELFLCAFRDRRALDEGFVKEYRSDGLHSHNPKYKTIRPMQDDNFRCVGRVLGAVTEDMLATPQELAVLSEVYSS